MRIMYFIILLFVVSGCGSESVPNIQNQDTPEQLKHKFFSAMIQGDQDAFMESHWITDDTRDVYRLEFELIQLIRHLNDLMVKRFGEDAWSQFCKIKINDESSSLTPIMLNVDKDGLANEIKLWQVEIKGDEAILRKPKKLIDHEITLKKVNGIWYVFYNYTSDRANYTRCDLKVYKTVLDNVGKPDMTLYKLKKIYMETDAKVYKDDMGIG